MTHLTPAERRAFPYTDFIPPDVLQRLSRAELADRLVYSSELVRKASRASVPAQKRTITQEIIAMMRAQPRGATERDVAQRIAKAASVPDAFHGSALRRSAQQLLDEHPPAPRNPEAELIVKATAGEDGLMACYDENGCIVGVCEQSALTPVLLPGEIAKARAAAESGTGTGSAPADVQALRTGPVQAGGTTGLGRPRGVPQRELPGDVPGRQVVKGGRRTS